MSQNFPKSADTNSLGPQGLLVGQFLGWILGNLLAYNTMGQDRFLSFLISSSLILFFMMSSAVVVRAASKKKSIALFGAAIVLKWPIVIVVLWWVLQYVHLDGIGLALGAILWVPASLIAIFKNGSK